MEDTQRVLFRPSTQVIISTVCEPREIIQVKLNIVCNEGGNEKKSIQTITQIRNRSPCFWRKGKEYLK
jgi:hypothetical protein